MRRFLLALSGLWLIFGAGKNVDQVYAANGCGGGQSCGVINVNVKHCAFYPDTEQCYLTTTGIKSGCDYVTDQDCYGWVDSDSCVGPTTCNYGTNKKISCCTSGSGGGTGGGCLPGKHQECGDECKRESNCVGQDSGGCGTAIDGEPKVWCRVCRCVGCAKTAPTNLNATSLTNTTAQITWTPGTDTQDQDLYLDPDETKVAGNCADGCLVKKTLKRTLQKGAWVVATNYTTDPVLTPETTYYYRIVNSGTVHQRTSLPCFV